MREVMKTGSRRARALTTAERALRKKNLELERERDFLPQAAAYSSAQATYEDRRMKRVLPFVPHP